MTKQSAEEKRLAKERKKQRIKSRIWEIDFLRGVCVILMIFDHIMFDFMLFGNEWNNFLDPNGWFYSASLLADWYWDWIVKRVIWWVVVCFFFVTSGISSSFSRSNLKRGVRVAVVALLVTVVTSVVDEILKMGGNLRILFGVLHCYAVCILFFELLKYLLSFVRIPAIRYAILAALAAGLIVGGAYLEAHPVYLDHNYLLVFGFTRIDYTYGDYFPLLPWLGIFLGGGLLGLTVYRRKRTLLPVLDRGWCRPVKFIGRHALLVYVAHQVVIFGIFYLTGMALGYA